jgi:thiamine-phosphate pyrophosphorylase
MTTRRPIDLSLYLVIGHDDTMGRSIADVVMHAVRGGVTAVQFRDKAGATRRLVEQARALAQILRPLGIPLIVNDRVDVALAAGADGVHVGQEDMPAADARKLVGPDAILGLSVTTLSEAKLVDPMVVDYVGVGPVFATPTKLDAAPPLGLVGTTAVCRVLSLPSVAIGGINHGNAADVRDTGAHGIAVVSAICRAGDPADAARRLVGAVGQRPPARAT